MMFKIDKGVPMPRITRVGGGRPTKYPLSGMDVGESFFVPRPDERTDRGHQTRLSSAANNWSKRNVPDRKFSVRTVTENGVKGARVWRVK